MKKYWKLLTAFVVALLASAMVMLAACATNYVGSYNLVSMKMEGAGMTVEYVAGQAYNGVTISADACTLEVSEDNTWALTINLMGMSSDSEGTWSTNDDGALVLTESVSGEAIAATLDGSALVFSQSESGMTMTLTLNKI